MRTSSPTAIADPPAPAATAEVYREHAGAVWSCLGRLGLPPVDREDALQEVFLVVHRRWSSFAGRSAIGTWIYGIAVRVGIAHLRRGATRARRFTADDRIDPIDPARDPQALLEHAEEVGILDALLGELAIDKRTVFVLSDVEGLAMPEVAEILALNVRTAYSRLRVARADFERAIVRWQARRAHVEDPPPTLARLRRHARESVPPRTWSAIAIAIEGGKAAAVGTAVKGIVVTAGLAVLATTGWIVATQPPAPEPVIAQPRAEASPRPRPSTPVPAVAAPIPPAPRIVERPPDPRPPTRPAAVPAADTLAAQTDLLRRARAALQRAPADTLARLQEQEALDRDGRFARERELLRIQALCALDRRADARNLAVAWVQAHPDESVDDVLAQRCR